MKSSSKLFPVALLSAEHKPQWSEDTYSLKPNNSPDVSVEFVLTRMSQTDNTAPKPLLWLPPFLQSRADWRERWELQLLDLLQHGYEIWLLDWRGHGLSPRAQRWAHTRLQELAQYDLPAAVAFINEQNPHSLQIVAEESAAQVWLAAQAQYAEPSLQDVLAAPTLLLWPVLGRVGLARYVSAMGWEDRQLEVTRQGVQLRNGFESLPRRLFDELLFGRHALAGQWTGPKEPSPFIVVDIPSRERALQKLISAIPQHQAQVVLNTQGHLRSGLLRQWLQKRPLSPAADSATPA